MIISYTMFILTLPLRRFARRLRGVSTAPWDPAGAETDARAQRSVLVRPSALLRGFPQNVQLHPYAPLRPIGHCPVVRLDNPSLPLIWRYGARRLPGHRLPQE